MVIVCDNLYSIELMMKIMMEFSSILLWLSRLLSLLVIIIMIVFFSR